MSKLYATTSTDAIKTSRTARGHGRVSTTTWYNFSGASSAEGGVELEALHRGNHVRFRVYHNGAVLLDFVVEDNGTRAIMDSVSQ